MHWMKCSTCVAVAIWMPRVPQATNSPPRKSRAVLREMGAGCTEDEIFTAESLSVAESMHRSFEQLADNLVSLNLAHQRAGWLSNHARVYRSGRQRG
jgi:hypothetical protein